MAKKRNTVKIGNNIIGDGHPVSIVAELGVNHLGDFERAKEMIYAAHESGADFLKFQTYIASKRYDSTHNPKGKKFISTLKEWQFSREDDVKLWEYAHSIGAQVFTSPFDKDSLIFADSLGSLAYKVAAYEVVNHELLKVIANTGKPVVISRGMTTKEELDKCVEIFKEYGVNYVLLHCISSYPTMHYDSNINMIHTLRERYNCPIGHSDHTRGTDIPPLAVAAGATMIEKHFTVNAKLRESDNPFSITPDELKELIWKVRRVETYMGSGKIDRIDTEKYMWDFRRHT